jgi:hypothetical protein
MAVEFIPNFLLGTVHVWVLSGAFDKRKKQRPSEHKGYIFQTPGKYFYEAMFPNICALILNIRIDGSLNVFTFKMQSLNVFTFKM